MGWFDEQIKQRVTHDDEIFSDSLMEMSGVIMGRNNISAATSDDRVAAIDAISNILRFYNVKLWEIPDSLTDMDEILEYIFRPSGFMRRKVCLKGDWYKNGIGAMLGTYKDSKKAVALIPCGTSGYEFADENTGKKVKADAETSKLLSEDAICFYRPLPLKPVNWKDFLLYMIQTLSVSDYIFVCLAAIISSVIGLLTPYINDIIFSNAVDGGNINVLAASFVMLAGVAITSSIILIIRQLIMAKIKTKMGIAVESSYMMRLLSLPAYFFKKYSSGELAAGIQYINGLSSMILEVILTVLLSVICSAVYFFQIYAYAPELLSTVLVVVVMTILLCVITTFISMKVTYNKMELSAKESGLVYSLFTGIQKIKLAGAEKRAFVKWANQYKNIAHLEYNPPMLIKVNPAIQIAITLVGTIIIYYKAINYGMEASDYMAFNVSYSMLMGSFMALSSMPDVFARIKSVYKLVYPILREVPELNEDRKVVNKLGGGIEINNVSFRYNKDMPLIIDNLSLNIKPGQHIAIVGKTGCGKSTLMRIMLGLEKPDKGAVYYDGKDLNGLDFKSLRKFMGIVMQNGKVFQGDIFSNIVISAPWLTLEDAWEAAEIAGLAEDIRNMPMGMNTIISEGGGGFSGGQKQRLMIARAIAPKPKILIFDEATSALDNITQKKISETLDKMRCTRIVIAHRLSTIKSCDRILVLDKGHIVEDGKYDELINKNGLFAELAERQRIN